MVVGANIKITSNRNSGNIKGSDEATKGDKAIVKELSNLKNIFTKAIQGGGSSIGGGGMASLLGGGATGPLAMLLGIAGAVTGAQTIGNEVGVSGGGAAVGDILGAASNPGSLLQLGSEELTNQLFDALGLDKNSDNSNLFSFFKDVFDKLTGEVSDQNSEQKKVTSNTKEISKKTDDIGTQFGDTYDKIFGMNEAIDLVTSKFVSYAATIPSNFKAEFTASRGSTFTNSNGDGYSAQGPVRFGDQPTSVNIQVANESNPANNISNQASSSFNTYVNYAETKTSILR